MTLHPELREALASIRAGGEANWYVLTVYLLHANTRGRAWPSLDTLSRETGYGRPAVIAARQWLVRAGALAKVSYALRIGEERTHPRKEVMQVTGVIAVEGRLEPIRVLAARLPAEAIAPGLPADDVPPPPPPMSQPGLPLAGYSAPGMTLEGYPAIPESAAAAAASPKADGAASGLAPLVSVELQAVGLVWQQEARQPLTPLLADILGEMVGRHGAETVVGAVREAVQAVGPGKFSVKYVIRILERWRVEGKGEAGPQESAGHARAGRLRRLREAGKKKRRQPVDFSEGRDVV